MTIQYEASTAFVVEYACPTHCRAEFVLDDVHLQFRHAQMRRTVDSLHHELHETGRLEGSLGEVTITRAPDPNNPLEG
jgi:hypothetical protein